MLWPRSKITPNFVQINPFKPEFTIVISIHYKPRVAVAMKMICCGLKNKENCHVLVNQFRGNFSSKNLGLFSGM